MPDSSRVPDACLASDRNLLGTHSELPFPFCYQHHINKYYRDCWFISLLKFYFFSKKHKVYRIMESPHSPCYGKEQEGQGTSGHSIKSPEEKMSE